MKIEVGKLYKLRNGDIVKIISHHPGIEYEWRGYPIKYELYDTVVMSWNTHGFFEEIPGELDIIEEVNGG